MKKIVSRITVATIVIVAISFSTIGASAQRRTREGKAFVACDYPGNFTGPRRQVRRASNFRSLFEAEGAVDRLLKAAGLMRNIVIEASESGDVNARSGVDGNGRRYIYYNPDFIQALIEKARTDWAALFVMAHEIGHLLYAHFLEDPEESNPREKQKILHRQELEADRYAAFSLRRMGASMEETEAAVKAEDEVATSSTHPPKELRLEAIRAGWNQANEQAGAPAARGTQETRPSLPPPPAPTSRPAQRPFQVSANNTSRRVAQDWWTWNVFIEATPEVLDQISCVVYRLHPTFNPNVHRICEQGIGPAFALKGNGWGVFRIQITVLTKDNKQYELFHDLSFR